MSTKPRGKSFELQGFQPFFACFQPLFHFLPEGSADFVVTWKPHFGREDQGPPDGPSDFPAAAVALHAAATSGPWPEEPNGLAVPGKRRSTDQQITANRQN